MKQSEILMVRKAISDVWEGVIPGTPFLMKAISHEEVDSGFWLVNDTEEGCCYVIDRDSGLMVTRAETRAKAKESFELLRDRAFKARGGRGYEEAKKRLLRLRGRPIWDPKKESEEEFAKRLAGYLAGWEKSYMEGTEE